MKYKGKGGIEYNLENAPFAQGGEGRVFHVIGKPNVVAKLYKNGLNNTVKERKLITMVNNPPSSAVMQQIAWPLDVLYDSSNTFVGFLMSKLAINEDLNVIYEYGPSSKYPSVPWGNKIIIAKNLCAVLDAVHEAGHVVGDLNPKNISVDPQTGHIIFVDTDSYHIEDNGSVYRCNVGMPEYLPVEIQKKMKGGLSAAPLPTFTQATDNFALAIHIFQLLMNGTHPFSCRVLPSQASVAFPQPSDNIINGDFPFINPKAGTAIPVFAPPLSILPKEMQDLFKRAFVAGHTNPSQRPSPEEWFKALTNLERQLKKCSRVSHHEYYNSLSQCPWCTADQNFNHGVTTANKTPMTQSTISRGMTPAYVRAPSGSSVPRSTTYTNPGTTTSGAYAGTYTGGYTGGYTPSYTRRRSKKKLIIILSIVIAVILALVIGLSVGLSGGGGGGPSIINLTTPTSLGVSNGQITWDSVKDASSYMVKVNGNEVPVSQNSFTLGTSYDAGTYTISIKAQGASDNVIESPYSDTITVVKPVAAGNVQISDGTLSWDNVSGYTAYRVIVNGKVIDTVQSNSYSLEENSIKIEAGQNGVAVAVAGDSSSVVDSNSSEIISITKLNAPLNVSVNEDTLSWQSVSGASGYVVKITGGAEDITVNLESNVNSYYLLGKLQKGSYQITVQAVGSNSYTLSSNLSLSYTYNLTETIISVSSKADLINIGNDLTAKYILQNDIDISGEAWTPIGTIAARFEGVLIGNGYSIIGLSLTSTDTRGAGFFGVVGESGKISDLNFVDVNISGGTTGYVGAVVGVNYGMIFDVSVSGTVGTSTAGDNVGGLVGRTFGSIYNCTNRATVRGGTNVGGIAGNFEFNNANMTFSGCINEGEIEGQARVGGLVGYARVARMVYIDKLTNKGAVKASGNYAGGICGYVEGISGQTGNFEACTNGANITSANYAGGCFGYVGNYINITLSNPADTSRECSNTGNITTTSGSNKGNIQGN